MREDHIVRQLNTLNKITPDGAFADESKMKILYGTKPRGFGFNIFSQSLSMTASMGLIAVLFVFIALGGVSTALRKPIFPTFEGVGSEKLSAEAGTINNTIDVRIKEVRYLSSSTAERNLSMAAEPQLEVSNLDDGATDEEIDQLLVRARNY